MRERSLGGYLSCEVLACVGLHWMDVLWKMEETPADSRGLLSEVGKEELGS